MTTPTPIEVAIDKVTSPMNVEETPETKEPESTPTSEIDQTGKDKPEGELPKDPANPEPEKDPKDPTPPQEPDYKKKFRESSSEANRILSVAKTQHEIIKTFTTEDQVTDDEMRALHTDYDDMTDAEKNREKRHEMESKRTNRIMLAQQLRDLADAREKAISVLVTGNPLLEKNADEFKKFVALPENEMVDATTLAKSFLYDIQDQDPKLPTEEIPAKPEPTMERGTASHGEKPVLPNVEKKPEEMNDDELSDLMVREPKKYMEHVQKMAKKGRK